MQHEKNNLPFPRFQIKLCAPEKSPRLTPPPLKIPLRYLPDLGQIAFHRFRQRRPAGIIKQDRLATDLRKEILPLGNPTVDITDIMDQRRHRSRRIFSDIPATVLNDILQLVIRMPVSLTRHNQQIKGPDSRRKTFGKRPGIRRNTENAKKKDLLWPHSLDNDPSGHLQSPSLNRRQMCQGSIYRVEN